MNQHLMFRKRTRQQWPPLWRVAQHLHCTERWHLGCAVEIAPHREAPTAAEAARYFDHGDLWFTDYEQQLSWRYEVKGNRQSAFTCATDCYPELFVSRVDAVDRHGTSVAAYIIVNNKLTHCAIVKQETRPFWRIRDDLAPNTGNVEDNYACPVKHVIFEKLESWEDQLVREEQFA